MKVGRLITEGGKRRDRERTWKGAWREAGQIYGDLYLIVHTKAIMG